MLKNQTSPTFRITIFLSSILITIALILAGSALMPGFSSQPVADVRAAEAETITGTIYIPNIMMGYPWNNPFGIESDASILEGNIYYNRALELNANWARIGLRVLWSELQPTQGGPILWDQLEGLENELRGMKAAGITPVIMVKHAPDWALIPDARDDGQLTACGPIKSENFKDFADFLEQLVARYSTAEFNVHNWEIGNEPDVDPNLVSIDFGFGCWGDVDDPLYGGEYYGTMLKNVAPSIRKTDPMAKIWLGGLLIGSPNTTSPGLGKPEMFLKGILEAGAADSFDVIPYHWHPSYWNVYADYDISGSGWEAWNGGVRGKASFIRQILDDYGVDKPLVLNETGFGCREDQTFCDGSGYPDATFFQNQADMLVRMYIRGISIDLKGIIWYTLNGPGWRNSGLLNSDASYRPAFIAYRTMSENLTGSIYNREVAYGTGIEAYEFVDAGERIIVVWALDPTATESVEIPSSQFISAQLRDGSVYSPTLAGSVYQFDVTFKPLFIRLTR